MMYIFLNPLPSALACADIITGATAINYETLFSNHDFSDAEQRCYVYLSISPAISNGLQEVGVWGELFCLQLFVCLQP